MTTLIDVALLDAPGRTASIVQGRESAICFARNGERIAFVDQLFWVGEGEAAAPARRFSAAGHRWQRYLPVRQIGLVSRTPTVLGHLSAQENLGLIEGQIGQGREFLPSVALALEETGLLAGLDLRTPAAALPWAMQVEINFLQMWLCEPECLMFDQLFDDDDCAPLLRLPALFRARFPLRAICHLQRGPLPAGLGVTDVIDLS